jgi:lysozyme family protein
MIPTLESMLSDVIRREGGFNDNPLDRGSATNFGITLAALTTWRQRPTTAEDVRNLTENEARAIYTSRYLTEPGLNKIADPYVLSLAFDCAVNHGPQRVIRWLQKIVGVLDDGNLGPVTEIAVNSYEPIRLYHKLLARRIVFYGEIINNDRSQAAFALGWLRRAAEFVEV